MVGKNSTPHGIGKDGEIFCDAFRVYGAGMVKTLGHVFCEGN